MKNKKSIKPTRCRFNLLRQVCNLIPEHEVSKIARETGVEDRSRTFSPWSHTVSLLDAQLTHCIGLNDLCDSLQLHSGPLSTIRGATPPSRNGLSHANRERPAEMAEKLFWRILEHLKEQSPDGERVSPGYSSIDTCYGIPQPIARRMPPIWETIPEQLLGVRGLATTAGAPSQVFIRPLQHTGHPHPVLSS